MRQNLRKEQRKAKRSKDFNKLHSLQTEYSKAIQKAKRESWEHTVSDLDGISATSKMYKLLCKEHSNAVGSIKKTMARIHALE